MKTQRKLNQVVKFYINHKSVEQLEIIQDITKGKLQREPYLENHYRKELSFIKEAIEILSRK